MYCITSYIIYTSTAFFLIHSNIRCLIVSDRKGKPSTHIFYFANFTVCNYLSNVGMLWMKVIHKCFYNIDFVFFISCIIFFNCFFIFYICIFIYIYLSTSGMLYIKVIHICFNKNYFVFFTSFFHFLKCSFI